MGRYSRAAHFFKSGKYRSWLLAEHLGSDSDTDFISAIGQEAELLCYPPTNSEIDPFRKSWNRRYPSDSSYFDTSSTYAVVYTSYPLCIPLGITLD